MAARPVAGRSPVAAARRSARPAPLVARRPLRLAVRASAAETKYASESRGVSVVGKCAAATAAAAAARKACRPLPAAPATSVPHASITTAVCKAGERSAFVPRLLLHVLTANLHTCCYRCTLCASLIPNLLCATNHARPTLHPRTLPLPPPTPAAFLEELRDYSMKLHTKSQAPKEGQAPEKREQKPVGAPGWAEAGSGAASAAWSLRAASDSPRSSPWLPPERSSTRQSAPQSPESPLPTSIFSPATCASLSQPARASCSSWWRARCVTAQAAACSTAIATLPHWPAIT